MFGKIIFLGGVFYILFFGAAVLQDTASPGINQQLATQWSQMADTKIASEPSTPQLVKVAEAVIRAGEEKAISAIHGHGGDSKLDLVLSLIQAKAQVLKGQVQGAISQNGGGNI
jgi:hypothetical protein